MKSTITFKDGHIINRSLAKSILSEHGIAYYSTHDDWVVDPRVDEFDFGDSAPAAFTVEVNYGHQVQLKGTGADGNSHCFVIRDSHGRCDHSGWYGVIGAALEAA